MWQKWRCHIEGETETGVFFFRRPTRRSSSRRAASTSSLCALVAWRAPRHLCFAHPPISPICRTPLFPYLSHGERQGLCFFAHPPVSPICRTPLFRISHLLFLFFKVFVFAHPPVSPICRTPRFPYLTFYSSLPDSSSRASCSMWTASPEGSTSSTHGRAGASDPCLDPPCPPPPLPPAPH